jgi:hypothetical protein
MDRRKPILRFNIPKAERRKRLNQQKQDEEWAKWRTNVYKRDKYTCQECGSKNNIEPHHIKPQYYFDNFRFDVNNGITLCHECHMKIEQKRKEMGMFGRCYLYNKIIKRNNKYYRFNWKANKWIETIEPKNIFKT